jgi:hypothetical protein
MGWLVKPVACHATVSKDHDESVTRMHRIASRRTVYIVGS